MSSSICLKLVELSVYLSRRTSVWGEQDSLGTSPVHGIWRRDKFRPRMSSSPCRTDIGRKQESVFCHQTTSFYEKLSDAEEQQQQPGGWCSMRSWTVLPLWLVSENWNVVLLETGALLDFLQLNIHGEGDLPYSLRRGTSQDEHAISSKPGRGAGTVGKVWSSISSVPIKPCGSFELIQWEVCPNLEERVWCSLLRVSHYPLTPMRRLVVAIESSLLRHMQGLCWGSSVGANHWYRVRGALTGEKVPLPGILHLWERHADNATR